MDKVCVAAVLFLQYTCVVLSDRECLYLSAGLATGVLNLAIVVPQVSHFILNDFPLHALLLKMP